MLLKVEKWYGIYESLTTVVPLLGASKSAAVPGRRWKGMHRIQVTIILLMPYYILPYLDNELDIVQLQNSLRVESEDKTAIKLLHINKTHKLL